jgi:adenylate kinase
MAGRFVIVIGTRGAGKSSVLKAVPKKYRVVNLGDFILAAAKKEGLAKDRDELRRLHISIYNKLKARAYNAIIAMKGNIVLDTHATIQHNRRFIPGLPKYFMDKLNVVGLFLIDADVETLLLRAKMDRTRMREQEPRQVLLDNRSVNLATFSFYSAYLNIPIYIINNEDGKLQASRKKFLEHLEDAFEKQ